MRIKVIYLSFIMLFVLLSNVQSANIRISWSPNTESDLAGYEIGYGTSAGNYTEIFDTGNVTSADLADIPYGTKVFIALRAYDNSGNSSSWSEEVSIYVPPINADPDYATNISAPEATAGGTTNNVTVIGTNSYGTIFYNNETGSIISEVSTASPTVSWKMSSGVGTTGSATMSSGQLIKVSGYVQYTRSDGDGTEATEVSFLLTNSANQIISPEITVPATNEFEYFEVFLNPWYFNQSYNVYSNSGLNPGKVVYLGLNYETITEDTPSPVVVRDVLPPQNTGDLVSVNVAWAPVSGASEYHIWTSTRSYLVKPDDSTLYEAYVSGSSLRIPISLLSDGKYWGVIIYVAPVFSDMSEGLPQICEYLPGNIIDTAGQTLRGWKAVDLNDYNLLRANLTSPNNVVPTATNAQAGWKILANLYPGTYNTTTRVDTRNWLLNSTDLSKLNTLRSQLGGGTRFWFDLR